jgi:hypothetical protein
MGKVTSGKELLAVSILCLLLSYKQPSSVCEDGEEIFLRLTLILANKTSIVVSGKRCRPISFSTLLVMSPHGEDDCIFVVIVHASVGCVVDASVLLSSLPWFSLSSATIWRSPCASQSHSRPGACFRYLFKRLNFRDLKNHSRTGWRDLFNTCTRNGWNRGKIKGGGIPPPRSYRSLLKRFNLCSTV